MILSKEQETKFRELLSKYLGKRIYDTKHKTFFELLFETMDFDVAEYINYDGEYQGDYLIFVRKNFYDNVFYLGKFGYGSCTGCDAIYAAESIDELVKIAKDVLFCLKEINYTTFNKILNKLLWGK